VHLRAAARNAADVVVLHHHPNDCIATVALAVNDLPPVALLNHADHVFWMGSSVADLVINFRESGADLAWRRRFVREQFLLPLPLSVPDEESLSRRAECRARLGVGEGEQVLLSVGTAYKYQPTEREDFFRAAKAILDRVPTARLFLVGVSQADYQRFGKRTEIERLHLVGPVDDTLPYNHAADVYLEGVPLGSCTALLEAAGLGVPVVRSYQSLSALLVSDDPAIDALVDRPASEAEYVETAIRLLSESQTRQSIGTELRKAVVSFHTGDVWLERLEALYQRLKSRPHSPMRLPSACAEETVDDIALACLERNDVCNVEWFVDHVLPSQSRGALIATLCSIHRMTSRRLIHPSTRRYIRALQGCLRGALRSRGRA
jgi:glycosyltransferase involved in cell wall biosynthesis